MRHIDEGALHDVEIRSILSQQGRELPGSLPHLRPAGEGGDVGADQGREGLGDDDVMWLRAGLEPFFEGRHLGRGAQGELPRYHRWTASLA